MSEINNKIQIVQAIGDGKTDDTVAIQQAFKKALENQSMAVFFPATEQHYVLSEPIYLEGINGLKIYGDGMGKSTIKQSTNKPLFSVERSENIRFEGLTLEQKQGTSNDPNEACISMNYTTKVFINQMRFANARSAIMVAHSSFLYIDGCVTQNMRYSHISLGDGTSDVWISGTHLTSCTTTLAERYALLHLGSPLTTQHEGEGVKNISINQCQFRNNMNGKGIEAHSVTNLHISNNHITDCSSGIVIGRENKPAETAAVTIHSQIIKIVMNTIQRGTGAVGYSGILVKGGQQPIGGLEYGTALGQDILVVGNTLAGFGNAGDTTLGAISVQWAKDIVVRNNVVDMSLRTAFVMVYTSNSTISDNQFINTKKSPNSTEIVPVSIGMGCYFLNFYKNTLLNRLDLPLSYGVYNLLRGMANYSDNTIVSTKQPYQVKNAHMNGKVENFKLGLRGWSKVTTPEEKIVQVCTTSNGIAVRSDGEKIGMTATGVKSAQSDGLTGELEFSGTVLDHLSLNEEFELEIDGNKFLFTLLKLKNGKIGIVAPEIPVSFTDVPVQRMSSEWKAY